MTLGLQELDPAPKWGPFVPPTAAGHIAQRRRSTAVALALPFPRPDHQAPERHRGRVPPSLDARVSMPESMLSLPESVVSSPRVVDVLQSKQNQFGMAQSQLLVRTSTVTRKSELGSFRLPPKSWFDVFLKESKFSNLPIVECHTRPELFADAQQLRCWEMLQMNAAYTVCKFIVLLRTVGRMLKVLFFAYASLSACRL